MFLPLFAYYLRLIDIGNVTVPNEDVSLTGFAATSGLGTLTIPVSVTIIPTGQAMTSGVGTLDPADQVMGLTGLAATSAVGSITPVDQVMGLTGQSATVSLGELSPLYTRDLSYNTSASYSIKTNNTSASYSNKTHNTSASYTDKTHAG